MKRWLIFLVVLLNGCTKVPPSALQPGLQFFTDIDEVRFVCSRSFHGEIEIVVRRPYHSPQAPPELRATINTPGKKPSDSETKHTEKKISEELFAELRSYVTRKDLIEHSLVESPVSTDGSLWILEGRKGDFVISHRRLNPLYGSDAAFVAIGMRLLDIADISIPKKELY